MGLTVYVLDERQKVRATIRSGITELIHSEADGQLTMEVVSGQKPRVGEYIAFGCRDGRSRLFAISSADEIDDEVIDAVEAEDAAREELRTTISNGVELSNKKATEALSALLAGTGWELGEVSADGEVGEMEPTEYETMLDAMTRIGDAAGVRLVPHYLLTGGRVTGKRIDVLDAAPVWRGRIISARTAEDIVLTEEEPPMGRVYAVGGYTLGEDGLRKRVTLADAVWSTEAGDPADKPAGQDYLDAPDWTGAHRRAFVYTNAAQTDPQALAREAWEALLAKKQPKQIGRANAGDITYADGYSHAQVQVNDLVGIRSRSGRAVRERVANVRWHYVFPDLTVLEFGEEQKRQWISTQIGATAQIAQRSSNSVREVRQTVEDNGVELYRAIEQLVELDDRTITEFREVWIDLDATKSEITQKASLQKVNDLTGQLEEFSTTVTVGIDGMREIIQAGDQTVAELKSTIDGLEHWVSDSEGNVAELTNTVRGLESTVRTADGKIATLSNTADGLTSTILGQGTAMAQLRTRIDEVAAEVTDANGNIGSLRVTTGAVEAKIQSAGDRVSALAVTADGLQYTLSVQGQEMTSIKARIDEISLSVKATSGAMGQLVVSSDRIAGRLQDASGKLTALQELTEERFRVVIGDIEEAQGEIREINGSTLWQERDSITGVVGKMQVGSDGKIYIKSGSGLMINEGGTSYGVYTSNNLTAGVIVNKINGGTVRIKAANIELDGYVTADALKTEIARVDDLVSGTTEAKALKASLVDCVSTLKVGGYEAVWRSGDFVTSVIFPEYRATTIRYMDWNGERQEARVLTPDKSTDGRGVKGTGSVYLGRAS